MTSRSQAARLTPADLRSLYDESLESGADAAFRKRRWGRASEFSSWLEQDALTSLEPSQALQLYRASGGRQAEAFGSTPVDELRDSLDFLLYDTIKLEGRFDECASDHGAYWLPGTSREFASWLLCLRNPVLLGVWNGNAERMLKRMGAYPESMKRGPEGIRYLDLMEALAMIRGRLGLRDFIEVDILAYLSTRPRNRQRKLAKIECSELDNALA